MVTEGDWDSLVDGRPDGTPPLSVVAVLAQQAKRTASRPLHVVASDGREWWVKPPRAPIGMALATELVVGRVGSLIGAPVCEVEPIDIPSALLPYEVEPGVQLTTGVGTATVDVPGAYEVKAAEPPRRGDDNNARRHVGVFALVDWCYGSDLQWLLETPEDWRLWSHDHGWYFPPSGANWTADQLRATVGQPRPIVGDSTGLDANAVDTVADALDSVTHEDLRGVLVQIPASWPVADEDLATLGWYLEERAPGVADRLRGLI